MTSQNLVWYIWAKNEFSLVWSWERPYLQTWDACALPAGLPGRPTADPAVVASQAAAGLGIHRARTDTGLFNNIVALGLVISGKGPIYLR